MLFAKIGNEVVSTASAVLDSENGLPLDEYYAEELNEIRNRDEKLVEVGLIASRKGKGSFRGLLSMIKILGQYGCQRDHNSFVIGLNPKSSALYNRMYNFQKLGEVKDYASLNNAPVCLMYTNLMHPDSRKLKAVDIILSDMHNTEGFDLSKRYLFAPKQKPPVGVPAESAAHHFDKELI